MNTILLKPTDVLFFRDGRPMEGALSGHGAAWPLPNVTDAAFHAALHRSGLKTQAHTHRRGGSGNYAVDAQRDRIFGSLVTAGPFPVCEGNPMTWFFPRPLDLQDATLTPSLVPTDRFDSAQSSLPDPLEYAVANRFPPNKDSGARAWLNATAFQRYLNGREAVLKKDEAMDDSAFSDTEATIGIAIDPATGTAGQGDASGKIYSAKYLRLRDNWSMGVLAATAEKNGSPDHPVDLIPQLVTDQHQLLVGGQQRLCTAVLQPGASLPLPYGIQEGFTERNGKFLLKWVLLSPAVWPEIKGEGINPHAGGWLPNWIDPDSGQVLLKLGDTSREKRESREAWRQRIRQMVPLRSKLVAAIVPKPVPVTGWALANETDRPDGGAKSTHLAVPAGAVYYFEADNSEEAASLAAALNWHGSNTQSTTIKNRRSTLLGEKGFGLGVCSTWEFFRDVAGRSPP